MRLKVSGNRVEYQLSQNSEVTIKVYNLLGQEVRTLVDEFAAEGRYQVVWDGRGQGGRRVASGVYLVRLSAGGLAATAKMVLVR